jgi:hypothetical protein
MVKDIGEARKLRITMLDRLETVKLPNLTEKEQQKLLQSFVGRFQREGVVTLE